MIKLVIDIAFVHFQNKHTKESIKTLRRLLILGQLANDLAILMKLRNMIGILTLNKRDFMGAIG